jgi:hypothetical protein
MNDDDNYETITTADGRRVRIVKDGGRVSVPLHMMDNKTIDQAMRDELRAEFADRQYHDTKLNKPGYRTADMLKTATHRARDIARERIADGYNWYDQMIADEYKNPNPPPRGSVEGDPCTLNGFPGFLVEEDGKLVCRIPRRDAKPTTKPAMSAYARRQEEEPDAEEQEPDEAEAGEKKTIRRSVPVSLPALKARHAAVTSTAYDEYDENLRSAFRKA